MEPSSFPRGKASKRGKVLSTKKKGKAPLPPSYEKKRPKRALRCSDSKGKGDEKKVKSTKSPKSKKNKQKSKKNSRGNEHNLSRSSNSMVDITYSASSSGGIVRARSSLAFIIFAAISLTFLQS